MSKVEKVSFKVTFKLLLRSTISVERKWLSSRKKLIITIECK